MLTFLHVALANLAVAALLAVLATLAGRCWRRPALCHSLWLLVLLKLLTPPLVPLPVGWLEEPELSSPSPQEKVAARPTTVPRREFTPLLASAPTPPARVTVLIEMRPGLLLDTSTGLIVRHPDQVIARQIEEMLQFDPAPAPPAVVDSEAAETPVREPATVPAPRWNWPALLRLAAGLWLGGAALWYGWVGVCLFRFHRLLRCAVAAPPDVQTQAQELAARLGLRRCPTLWLLPGPLPPMVWAAFGPARLLFPARLLGRLDADGRATLLLHELAHLRRRDHWVRWLELLAVGLYWWCPLAWWARRQLHTHEEECCDAWVVAELSPRCYAGAILETIDFLAEARPALPAAASGLGRLPSLKKRLTAIMQHQTPKRLSAAGWLAVLACAALLPLRPAPAAPKKLEAKPPAPTRDQPAKEATPAPPVLPEARLFDPKPILLQNEPLPLESVALSKDGRLLATVGGWSETSGELRVWDLGSGRTRFAVKESKGVRTVAFSPDGALLAAGDFDNLIKLRDTTSGKVVAVLRGHSGAVNGVAFFPNGKTLASASLDHTVRLWDVTSGQSRAVLRGHSDWVLSVAVAPDGKTVASSSRDQTARLWDVATSKERFVLKGHVRGVEMVAFSPDSATLATAAWDNLVKLWDVETGKEKASLQGHSSGAMSVAFSPDGKTIATGSSDRIIKLWDAATRKELASLDGHADTVFSVAFSADGKKLASASTDTTARLWDVARRKELAVYQRRVDRPEDRSEVLGLAYAPDGKTIAIATEDKTVQVREVASGRLLRCLAGHEDIVTCVCYGSDSKVLATGSPDRSVRLWDAETGKEKKVLRGHKSWVYAVALSPDGKTLASAGYDKTIHLWDAETGKEKGTLVGHTASVRAVTFSRDGKLLASAGSDRSVRLWDVTTRKEKAILEGHRGTVRAVGFAPDGATLATAGEDGEVRLWDVTRRTARAILKGHEGEVWALAWSPQGQTLITGGQDKTVRVWDVAGERLRLTLRGHDDGVSAVALAPGGRQLASGSHDKTVKLWNGTAPPLPANIRRSGAKRSQPPLVWEEVQALFLIAPDLLAAVHVDGTVTLWKVARVAQATEKKR
jgi:WD40 repeat protein/beta-lactamase regulating signal transducer with metallopeptidase domain